MGMVERPQELGDLKGWVIYWGKILGWRVPICANICGLLDREWLDYKFAAGSFHTKKLCNRLYSIALNFIFWATLWELRGNVHTPSIPRWKTSGQLPIRHNWNFFQSTILQLRCKQKSVEVGVFRRGWVTLNANFIVCQPLLVSEN